MSIVWGQSCLHYFYIGVLINMTLNIAEKAWVRKEVLFILGANSEAWMLLAMFGIVKHILLVNTIITVLAVPPPFDPNPFEYKYF